MTTTPAPTQQMREKFEAWCKSNCYSTQRFLHDPEIYMQENTQDIWCAWQSAHQCGREEERAPAPVDLGEISAALQKYTNAVIDFEAFRAQENSGFITANYQAKIDETRDTLLSALARFAGGKDGEFYRFIRDQADPDNEQPHAVVHIQNDWGKWYDKHLTGAELDAACLAALSTNGEAA